MHVSQERLLQNLREEGVNFIAFCFTDTLGTWHKITYHINAVTEDILLTGVGFDGSSIQGWKEIHHSDSVLQPDLSTGFMDPFTAQECYCIICDVIDPQANTPYLRDPRYIARQAEQYALNNSLAEHVYVGPEMEFFIFDDVRFQTDSHHSFFKLGSYEAPYNSGRSIKGGANLGYRPHAKGGYFPAQPTDTLFDIRAEICSVLAEIGLEPSLHHHEVATAQCEVGFKYASLLRSADNVQKFKYAARNVATSYGKTVTFMPKPIFGDNGSGMHTHLSLWKGSQNLFYQAGTHAELSQTALYFIGGIIKHAKTLNAFTNPTTNSYKRLVPGYEAPVNLAYSAHNRSAAIRIPYSNSANAKRIEVRFPDPTCNPYLGFAALLMAGCDGITHKIDPGQAIDENLYSIADKTGIESVCGSLQEALEHLDQNRAFLTAGNVFSNDFINSYIALKSLEIKQLEMIPHPLEYKLYFGA